MQKFAICILCLFGFIFINCGETNNRIIFDHDLFIKQKHAWKQTKPENYEYHFTWKGLNYGFKPGMSALIIVENGQYINQIPDENDLMREVGYEYQTIDKIYELIESIYNQHLKLNRTDLYIEKIEINYDLNNHIPLLTIFQYYVEPGTTDIGKTDSYEIKNFKIKNIEND